MSQEHPELIHSLSRSLNRGPNRRLLLQATLASGAALLLRAGMAQSAPEPRRIQLTAKRFAYQPNEIALKLGEPVIVEISSLDFVHGMNIPQLGKRLDLVPGRVTPLLLTPTTPGIIDFVCDNFCGDGHEQMHGRFVVSG